MILLVLGIGGALLATPGLVLTSARGLSAAQWAKSVTTCLVMGAVVLEAGLLLLGAPTVLQAVDHNAFASACKTVLDRLAPGGAAIGWTAAVLGVVIATTAFQAAIRARRQTRSAHVDPCLGTHADHGQFDLVVVPTQRVIALGVPGSRPQVVLSEGLLHTLSSREVEAVIDHEAAHHRLGHYRHLMVASVLERTLGRLPLIRRSTTTLRNALEQWADDEATSAAPTASRELRNAIMGVACAKAAGETPTAGVRSCVLDRTHRLGRGDRPRTRFAAALTYATLAAVGVTALALAVGWLTTTHHALALSDYCPT
jgi:beta-lactamase regulating signal transducer with metallopeptidase domain